MKLIKYFSLCLFAVVLVSCDVELQPINYNVEQCASCKMIISDKRFGAELVTHKGKVYKYDATECLLRTLVDEGMEKYLHIGINYYTSPGILVDALNAQYLVSLNMPSPMGGNLNAFSSKEEAEKFRVKNGGEVYDFEGILNEYKKVYGH